MKEEPNKMKIEPIEVNWYKASGWIRGYFILGYADTLSVALENAFLDYKYQTHD